VCTSEVASRAVPDGGVACRHRLTIKPNDLPQPSGDPGLRVRECHAFCTNPALPTAHAPLPVDQRDTVRGPGQVVPSAQFSVAHLPSPPPTARTGIATNRSAFQPDPQSNLRLLSLRLEPFDSISFQPQNPGKLAMPSHVSSLPYRNTERTPSGLLMTSGPVDRFLIEYPIRAGSRTLTVAGLAIESCHFLCSYGV
jgi:hypothetical protein